MRKYLSFGVFVMVVLTSCVGFSSCSKDDDEDNSGGGIDGSGTTELYLDGNKIPVYSWYNAYTNYDPSMNNFLQIEAYTTKEVSMEMEMFHFDLTKINLEEVKAGDDLTKKAKYYEIGYRTKTNDCFSYEPIAITVVKNDFKNHEITFEFKDVKIKGVGLFGKPDENHIITGKITAKYKVNPLGE